MLAELGVYQEIFETPFLERTGVFFATKSQQKFEANILLPDYLQFAAGLIQIEGKFAHFYLQKGTFLKVVDLLEAQLIAQHRVRILEGLPSLLDSPEGWQHNQGALCTLYEFFDQTNLIPELLKSWKKYIE